MLYARGNPAKWWTSRSVGIPSRAPASIGGIGGLRKLTSIVLLATLAFFVFSVWYITNPTRVARLAENLLTSVFASGGGGNVTVKSAHLSFSGTLLLSGVELNTEPSPGSSSPLPVFSADQIEVRFDWISLISGKLAATQLIAFRPTLFLIEDTSANRWNYERLRAAASRDARPAGTAAPQSLPVVILRAASIEWGELEGSRIQITGKTIVDGQLVPQSNSSAYDFQITRSGSESPRLAPSGSFGALVTGSWDVTGNRFVARMGTISLNDDLKIIFPRSVRRWWDEHHVAGTLSQLQINYDVDQGLVLEVNPEDVSFEQEVQPRPSDGAGPPQRYPVTFKKIKGDIRLGITKPGLKLTRVTGQIMQFPFTADAELRGLSPESPFDLTLHFKNANLPRQYPPLFMASLPAQDLLQRVAPWGNFDLDLSIKRLSWNGDLFLEGQVLCKNGNMRFCHFPYPLHNVNGKITFNNEIVTFKNVTAQGDETSVVIDGTLGATPSNTIIDFTVSSNGATFDDRLGACLPEKYKFIWDQFALTGRGKFVCKASRPSTATFSEQPVFNVSVDLDNGHGYVKQFPYRLYNAKGRIVFTADQTLVQKLTVRAGADQSGTLTFDGAVKHPKGDVSNLQPELTLTADVPIDRALIDLFPPEYSSKVENADLAGRLTFGGTVKRSNNPAVTMPQINGDLGIKNGSFKLHSPPPKPQDLLALSDVNIAAHLAGTSLAIKQASAHTPEGLKLTATGDLDIIAGTGKFQLAAMGTDITLPQKPPPLFPDHARVTWVAYNPKGTIDLDASATVALGTPPTTAPASTSAPAAPPYTLSDYSLAITAKRVSLNSLGWPDSVRDLTGKISATPAEITFTDVKGITGTIAFGLNGSYNPTSGHCTISGAAIAEEPPTKWLRELPTGFVSFIDTNKPTGQFQLKVERLERETTGKPWTFKGSIAASNAATNGPPSSISLAAGKISAAVTGTYDPAASALDMDGALAGTDLSVSGKLIDTITAGITARSQDRTLKFSNIDGKVAGGALHGTITATFKDNPGYSGDLTLSDAQLATLVLSKDATEEERKKLGNGLVTANIALQQTFGDANGKGADRTGRGDLVVRDGKIYDVPLSMGLMQIATFRLPVSRAFDRASMTYYIRDNKVTFEKILLESPGINLVGGGNMSLRNTPPTLELSFITESPRELFIPVVTQFIQGTRNELLQIAVTGPINDPKVTPVPLNPLFGTLQNLLPHKKQ